MATSDRVPELADDLREHHERVLDELEELQPHLETIAATDSPLGERARNALAYLDEHRRGDDE